MKTYKGFEAIERLKTNKIALKDFPHIVYSFENGEAMRENKDFSEIKPSVFSINSFFELDFIDYVEQSFKKGDFVVDTSKTYFRVEKVIGCGVNKELKKPWITVTDLTTSTQYFDYSSFRKATPEEIAQEKRRRMFAKVEREVDEWKVGDIFEYDKLMHKIVGLNNGFVIGIEVNGSYRDEYSEWAIHPICFVENVVREE